MIILLLVSFWLIKFQIEINAYNWNDKMQALFNDEKKNMIKTETIFKIQNRRMKGFLPFIL